MLLLEIGLLIIACSSEKFEVRITASNGYEKTNWTLPDPFTGFEIAKNLSGKAITLAAKSAYLGAEVSHI